MKTHKQYMNKEVSHAEYFNQFVDDNVIKRVSSRIGKDRIKNSNDEHFNDIPLVEWDRVLSPLPRYIGDKIREAGTFPTLADCVCISKQAARLIKES